MKSNKNKQRFLDNKYNRYSVIAVEVALLITMVIGVCIIFKSGALSTKEPTTLYVLQNQKVSDQTSSVYGTQYVNNSNAYNISQPFHGMTGNNAVLTTGNRTPQTIVVQNNSGLENPSGWTTQQILSKASEAINKTKGYTANLSVHHVESFSATVTECTGGSIVQSVANAMVGWVVEPVDETLNFSGGMATNSEGETVPILLPKRGSFTLGQSGVTGASAKTVNGEYVVNINLVQESVGMTQVPQHNAAGIGYLDVSSFDLSFLTVDSADITYKGSSIELHINQQGYVTYALYRVPLTIKGSGHSGAISGAVTFDGEQTEQWTFVY